MSPSIAIRLKFIALALVLGTGPVSNADAQENDSGFLKDYSQLKNVRDSLAVERRIWVSPDFNRAKYQKVLIEPVTFFPAPEPSGKVPKGTLSDIRNYMDSALRKAMGGAVGLSDAPGPGVARVRVAITAAGVEGIQLKPYQLVPVALAATAAKEAAGKSNRKVELFVESEVTDSVSGEPLALVVRDAKGVQVKSNEQLTLQAAKPQIDAWAQAVREYFAARLK